MKNILLRLARFLNRLREQAQAGFLIQSKARKIKVEVLHGNQAGSKHSRRQSDKIALGDNRILDWGKLESDIDLFPHSPLALADVLSQQGGFLDLIPCQQPGDTAAEFESTQALPASSLGAAPPSTTQTELTSQSLPESTPSTDASKRPAQKPTSIKTQHQSRSRFNLLTQHNDDDLLKQCKKILVENALVKNKGERQLYLAAGFLSWADERDPIQRKRAPLLLYPALLVRVPDEARYEVRFTGDSPEFNQNLLIYIKQQFNVTVPEFDHDTPLSDFLAQVAQSVQGQNKLSLEFEVALGSASLKQAGLASFPDIELPDVPTHFNVSLAMSIAGNKSLPQLNAVLQLIPNYIESVDAPSAPDQEPALPLQPESVAGLRQYAARLAAEGLDHVEFKQLTNLPTLMTKWTAAAQAGMDSTTINKVLKPTQLSTRELIRLASIIELIDKAPDVIDSLGHSDLCYSNSTLLLRRAQHQAKLIEDELEALQKHFVLDKVPAKSKLLSLMSELGATMDHEPDLVDADYFNARRQFMEFSIQKPGNLTAEHRRQLSQLAKVLRFRELFVNNTEYRTALGPGYKGLRTDWDKLLKVSEYAREIAEVLESEIIAGKILSNWQAFRSAYSSDLETLQTAADGCRRLLGTLGTRWQSQSVPALLSHANLISRRLVEWRTLYGSIDSHASKTPAAVLSSFSGKSHDDVLVETQVDETRTRIDQQLEAGEISREQITDTLNWLLAASSAAAEHEMDINAIVGHLQIA